MVPLNRRNLSNVFRSLDSASLPGELALAKGWISEDQLKACLEEHRNARPPRPVGEILRAYGWISAEQLDALRTSERMIREEGSAEGPPPFPEGLPRRVGRYRLLEVLGEGGMGLVFRARDEELGRDVALKMLKTALALSEGQLERFRREGRNAARLSHPAIVKIHDVGREGDVVYYTMERVSGKAFDTRQGALADRVKILEQAARAVQYAHEQGVIHRDLKPANILVDGKGHPHLLDFGLSRDVEAPSELTRSAAFLGTPQYMAPEQASGRSRDVDARSDVWALGVILYEILAGRLPFEGETVTQVARKVIEEDPQAPPGPQEAVTICLKALEKDPARRYSTAGALADDLSRFLAGDPIAARPPSRLYLLRRGLFRHRVKAAMLACLLVSAAVVLWSLAPSPSQAALLESLEGEVYLVTPTGRLRAQAGVTLVSGQGVDTLGPRSRARLTYDDGTQVDLAADSRLRLSPGLSGHGLYLEHGSLTAGVESQLLVLTTPQADVRADGAAFTVTARPTWTRLEVLKGRVRLTRLKDGASVEVPAGQVAEAEPGVALVARPIVHDRKVPRTGLELWLDAGQGVTVEGTGVSRWADQSGRGRHAAQEVTASRPRLIKSAIAGKPALQFSDEKLLKIAPGFGDFSAGLSVFLVARPSDFRCTYLRLDTSSKEGSDAVYFGSYKSEFTYHTTAVRPAKAALSAPHGSSFGVYQTLAAVHAPSGAVTLYCNGEAKATGTCPLPEKVERAWNTVGTRRDADPLEGDLAEILVYSRALSEAERQDVERYLYEKYLNPALEPASAKRGLLGEYFADDLLRDSRGRRVDPRVDFCWGPISPVPQTSKIGSVRWTGFLEPEVSESYIFSLAVSGPGKVWIDDRLVLEAPAPDGGTVSSKPVSLKAGQKVRLRIEASPRRWLFGVRLLWNSPSTPRDVIPQDRLWPSAEGK